MLYDFHKDNLNSIIVCLRLTISLIGVDLLEVFDCSLQSDYFSNIYYQNMRQYIKIGDQKYEQLLINYTTMIKSV